MNLIKQRTPVIFLPLAKIVPFTNVNICYEKYYVKGNDYAFPIVDVCLLIVGSVFHIGAINSRLFLLKVYSECCVTNKHTLE